MHTVLGVETSCDETAVAIYHQQKGLLAHNLYSQVPMHAQYGGVVPELAARDHVRKIIPLMQQCLADAEITLADLDGVAYTAGPGLLGAVMSGAAVARSLGWGLGIPTLGIHHMEGHLLAPFLEDNQPELPFVALLVSGGHTLLVAVEQLGCYRILGESVDDAVGEAFDKTAKLLGLPYPGGPAIEALARDGDATRFTFPRPMCHGDNLDFSFSGLKTSVLQQWRASDQSPQTRADIASSFQQAAIDTLVYKCRRALAYTGFKQLVVAGGVSANQLLRQNLTGQLPSPLSICYPITKFCTDNAAMIAYAGMLRLNAGEQDDNAIRAQARWSLTDLQAI